MLSTPSTLTCIEPNLSPEFYMLIRVISNILGTSFFKSQVNDECLLTKTTNMEK